VLLNALSTAKTSIVPFLTSANIGGGWRWTVWVLHSSRN